MKKNKNKGRPERPILIVDDDKGMCEVYRRFLEIGGFGNVSSCLDSRQVFSLVEEEEPEIVLLDLSMPHIRGEVVLTRLSESIPRLPIIVITGNDDVSKAVQCMKAGAYDYLTKPVGERELVAAVRQALEISQLRYENEQLRQSFLSLRPVNESAFEEIVTQDEGMFRIFHYIEAVAGSDSCVLITGETGVGKELVAKAVHELSRREGAFVSVNVAGLDDEVFADTLFGHKAGAYTGASTGRMGLIAQARGGTLFLDEIGHLGAASQAKLLRFLQEGEYLPLGADDVEKCDVRVVAATNVHPQKLREEERFRQDLFYRLCSHHVHIPPLRERKGDLPLLLNSFLEIMAKELDVKTPKFPKELITLLGTHHFPGNVRELKAMVHDALYNHSNGSLSMDRFKEAISNKEVDDGEKVCKEGFWGQGELPTLKEAEEYLINEALRRAKGNQTIAASLLGLTRQALNKRLSRKRQKEG